MKIEQAIGQYIEGLRPSLAAAVGAALRLVFKPVLGEDVAILTADQLRELGASLARRAGDNKSLSARDKELHSLTVRTFLAWCVESRLLSRDPLAPRKVEHLGELARRLREAAGLLRQELAAQTGLLLPTLQQFETGRRSLTREQLLRLLRHPCMDRLPDEARAAGLALGLGNNGAAKD